MTAIYTPKSDNLAAFLETTGAQAAGADLAGNTLAAGTYYVPLGGSEALLASAAWIVSVEMKWNAVLAATITLESCNFPATVEGRGTGRPDVTDFEASTAQNWIQENPTNAIVYSSGGTGNAVANLTITAGGTAAGSAIAYLPNAGARRYRLKVVVTTPGTLRVGACGKE